MKKIFAVFSSLILCLSLCSCSDDSADKEAVFKDFRNYISETALDDDYYIQISKTASDAQTLTEASRMDEDCAFMQYDFTGALKFYRNDKYTVVSSATFFIPEEKDAQWTDFDYENMAQQYREIIASLCSEEIVNTESETPIIKSIDISDNDSKEFPEKYSVQFDPSVLDTRTIFKSAGNFGSVSIKFLTDKNHTSFSDVSLNCQYDYNDEIYLVSVIYGTPDEPDEKGENGHRPEDIEDIFQGYLDDLEEAYNSTDYNYEDYLDEYMNQNK
ncbi:hypothetical protein [Porcipelethomonas sp.]|uniref:hypothetical protein n=1 Tax=Porcipelethomonas sp. TaxID=2981675 RepID=UPI003EF2D2B6